jgi:hypothetical protein
MCFLYGFTAHIPLLGTKTRGRSRINNSPRWITQKVLKRLFSKFQECLPGYREQRSDLSLYQEGPRHWRQNRSYGALLASWIIMERPGSSKASQKGPQCKSQPVPMKSRIPLGMDGMSVIMARLRTIVTLEDWIFSVTSLEASFLRGAWIGIG